MFCYDEPMDITFLGHSCFKIRGKNATVVTDPFDPVIVGLKLLKLSADIVTVSHEHGDHNKIELVNEVRKVISGPGEYEIQGVSIIGMSTFHDDKRGKLRGKNTVYVIEIDGLRVAHLGDLGHNLSDKRLEQMGTIDILMIPVGGDYTINSQVAVEVARAIEPVITIPMHYQMKGLNPKMFAKLSKEVDFVSDLGLQSEKLDKINVKKEILGEDQRLVVLEKK